jgi:hypothetical protein
MLLMKPVNTEDTQAMGYTHKPRKEEYPIEHFRGGVMRFLVVPSAINESPNVGFGMFSPSDCQHKCGKNEKEEDRQDKRKPLRPPV